LEKISHYLKRLKQRDSLFGWLVADGWCWFVLREEYCWLVAGGWFVVREKYYWLVAGKPSEHGVVEWLILANSKVPYVVRVLYSVQLINYFLVCPCPTCIII
jgi:hypothetical protein